MADQLDYTIYKDGEEHTITINPVNQNIPGGDLYVTGVFRLSEGEVGLGDIVFDDNMKQWEYTGMGDLSHEEAAEIAGFIQVKNSAGANNEQL